MALEWVVLGHAAAAEAIMLLLTMPGLGRLRTGIVVVKRRVLKPILVVVPFCLFLFLLKLVWVVLGYACSPTEYFRHQKSIMKSQRNAILILYSVSNLVVRIEQLSQRVEKLKQHD